MSQFLNELSDVVIISNVFLLGIMAFCLMITAIKIGLEPHMRIRHMFYPVLHKVKKSEYMMNLKSIHPKMQALITISGEEKDKDKVVYYIMNFSAINNKALLKEMNDSLNNKKILVLLRDKVDKNDLKSQYKNLFNGIRIPPDTRVDIWYF